MILSRFHAVAIASVVACVCNVSTLAATDPLATGSWQDGPYPYSVVSESVSDAIKNFGYNTDVRVSVSPDVKGVVQGRVGRGTARQFLDEITKVNDLDWYSDGSVLYVSPASEEQTVIVPLNGYSFDLVKEGLATDRLFDQRYRLSRQVGGDGAVISGPPSFVAVMKQAIAARTGGERGAIDSQSRSLVVLRGSQSASLKLP